MVGNGKCAVTAVWPPLQSWGSKQKDDVDRKWRQDTAGDLRWSVNETSVLPSVLMSSHGDQIEL